MMTLIIDFIRSVMMLDRFLKKEVCFIVYQMGKVGSSTLKISLERRYGNEKVVHVHKHEEAKDRIEEMSRRFRHLVIISGFREPLSRCISAYFQNLTVQKNHWFVGDQKEVTDKSTDWLIRDYNQKVVPHIQDKIGPWLENYQKVTGCSIEDFRKMKGCWKASTGRKHLFLYKLEALSEFYQTLSGERFFADLRLVDANRSEDKWYSGMYKDFRKDFKISEKAYDDLYGSIEYVRTFYDKEELRLLTKNHVME